MLGNGTDKVDVVTDEDEGAGVILERADQRIDTGHIEVSRRLVE